MTVASKDRTEGADPGRNRPLRLCLFGAAPDTANLGVSALCCAVIQQLARCARPVELTVFDYGRGRRRDSLSVDGRAVGYTRVGARRTRRFWQAESLARIRLSARLGGLGNAAATALRSADAILDVSGGDSFTDLYGPRRFAGMCAPKRLAIELGRPLVLLPQTYGPYEDARVRSEAARLVRGAAQAWARDERSFAVLRDLLGDAFEPGRHRCGVDLAFCLKPERPAGLPAAIADWLTGTGAVPTVGFNTSGLIFQDPGAARDRFGFRADYRELVLGMLRWLLRATDANVLLVPHVLTPPGHYESDPGANLALMNALQGDPDARVRNAAATRLAAVDGVSDPREMKWVIGRCDWFCGTRMHATIAGLSSGVPTAAIAYSPKTQGVFETCGVGDAVVDPRSTETAEAVERMRELYEQRSTLRSRLEQGGPPVVSAAGRQVAELVQAVARGSAAGAAGSATRADGVAEGTAE